jgi:hypothetical protein
MRAQPEPTVMIHPPFASLEAMLSEEAMSELEERTVSTVTVQRWTPPALRAASGNHLLRVESGTASGERHAYIVKRITPERDLLMRLSCDTDCRERLVWQHGLLDGLPDEVWSPVVASAIDGTGWAVLMHDVTESLVVTTNRRAEGWMPLSDTTAAFGFRALAALHAAFYEAEELRNPALKLCSLYHSYACLSPAAAQRESDGGEPVLTQILDGWAQLEHMVPGDIARAIRGLQADPTPLCNALERYPRTLVHGDARVDNLAFSYAPRPRLTLLDWQFVGALPPALDMLWLLNSFSLMDILPMTRQAAIDLYTGELARRLGPRFSDSWWQPQLELAMVGQFLRSGWWWMTTLTTDVLPAARPHVRAQLDLYCEALPRGLQRL